MARAPQLEETVRLEAPVLAAREGAARVSGWAWWRSRGLVLLVLLGLFVLWTGSFETIRRDVSQVFVFAIVALSLNLLMGYAGQISLGHQAFFGIGAFTSAGIVSTIGSSFWAGIIVAVLAGALSAGLIGVVALRLRGLYLALITLAFGFFAENVLFGIRGFSGGVAGVPAPRPAGFTSDLAFLYLVAGFFALVQFVDWRLVSSKTGRAIRAIRDDERVASSLGVNVTFYKVLAFVLSGAFAGLAGALFAHESGFTASESFSFQQAITFVFIAVVGGLGSRLGVFVGAAFFTLLQSWPDRYGWFNPEWTLFIGAALLVLTLVLHPGGIAELLRPVTKWFEGGRFRLSAIKHPEDEPEEQAVAAEEA